ncbi:uncharacterized protein LOC112559839 [Pomacea canaliculata]|uniref:uncharacterized protein LOC112559839 n=1 Tax=Pomacea canaliculata TaxID=400727 RepID=UPI000D733F85|nr:uncharacterized protein LOC112559839 [Pomacea canaliculata]
MEKKLVSVLFFCCWLTATHACTCLMPDHDSYCTMTIVFHGIAEALDIQDNGDTDVYTFWIDQIFWAPDDFNDTQAINVTSHSFDSLCGFSFELDTPYVVAARFVNGVFRSGLCDGNQLWNSLPKSEKRFFSRRLQKHCARKNKEQPEVAGH